MWKGWQSVLWTSMIALSLAACGGNSSGANSADSNYPDKPITIVVPSGAGGGIDMAARSLAKVADQQKLVSQPIMVENKPGGGQVVGTVEFANKEARNDYKLLLTSTPFVLNYVKKEGNSPVSFRDLAPLARLQTDYGVLAVKPDSKYKDLQSLFDAMKADPNQVVVAGGSSPGSFDHLNVILPATAAGVDAQAIKYIAYDGGGEAVTALLGGSADVLSSDVSGIMEFVKAGKARVLGVSSGERLPDELKDFPTYKEQGVDAVLTNWRGIFGPKEMSADAKAFWQEKLKALAETEEWKTELKLQGVQDGYMAAEEFAKTLEADETMYKEIYTNLGMAK